MSNKDREKRLNMTENCLIPTPIANCLYESGQRLFNIIVTIGFNFNDDNIDYCNLCGDANDVLFEIKDIKNSIINDDNKYVISNDSILYLTRYRNVLIKTIANIVRSYSNLGNWDSLTAEMRILSALVDMINLYKDGKIILID